jgi:hypothetical protein
VAIASRCWEIAGLQTSLTLLLLLLGLLGLLCRCVPQVLSVLITKGCSQLLDPSDWLHHLHQLLLWVSCCCCCYCCYCCSCRLHLLG